MIKLTSREGAEAAATTLLSLFPPSINITVQGGGVVALPSAIIVNDCEGSQTTSVAVCSFVSSATSGDFWLASPWFNNRFVLMDMRAPNPDYEGSVGTIYWGPVSECNFSAAPPAVPGSAPPTPPPYPSPPSPVPPPYPSKSHPAPPSPSPPSPTVSSYVISVNPLHPNGAPYMRGIGNQLIQIGIGSGDQVTYFNDSVSPRTVVHSSAP